MDVRALVDVVRELLRVALVAEYEGAKKLGQAAALVAEVAGVTIEDGVVRGGPEPPADEQEAIRREAERIRERLGFTPEWKDAAEIRRSEWFEALAPLVRRARGAEELPALRQERDELRGALEDARNQSEWCFAQLGAYEPWRHVSGQWRRSVERCNARARVTITDDRSGRSAWCVERTEEPFAVIVDGEAPTPRAARDAVDAWIKAQEQPTIASLEARLADQMVETGRLTQEVARAQASFAAIERNREAARAAASEQLRAIRERHGADEAKVERVGYEHARQEHEDRGWLLDEVERLERLNAQCTPDQRLTAHEEGRRDERARIIGLRNHLLRNVGRGDAASDRAAVEAFDGMLLRGEHAPGAKT